jgi:hypothetical protein
MPQQDGRVLAPRRPDLRPPRAAQRTGQYYEVEDADGSTRWLRADELVTEPAPVTVRAIAWRV